MRSFASRCNAPTRCCPRHSRSAMSASAQPGMIPGTSNTFIIQHQDDAALRSSTDGPDQRNSQHQQHTVFLDHHSQQQQQSGLSPVIRVSTEQQQQIEALQRVLHIPFHQAEQFAHQTPSVLRFEPQTLRITIDTLCQVLHLNHHTVVAIIQQRPGILQCPDEPVVVQQQLAVLLGVTCWRVANLLGSQYAHLLALTPMQLENRCMRLCEVMHWRPDDLQTAAKTTGPEAFIHLLSTPASHIATQLAALAASLDCADAPAAVAAVVQHYPRLLEQRDNLLWPPLKVLADTAGVSPRQLLSELDPQQCKGLSAILLYEPVWVQAQLRSLSGLIGTPGANQSQEPCVASALAMQETCTMTDTGFKPGRLLVWLLCRLATPNRLAMAKVRMRDLQLHAAAYQPWQDELQHADDLQLSVLLTASHEAMQQLRFLVDTGRENMCGMSLLDVVSCSLDDFRRRYGLVFDEWRDEHDTKTVNTTV